MILCWKAGDFVLENQWHHGIGAALTTVLLIKYTDDYSTYDAVLSIAEDPVTPDSKMIP